MPNSLVKSSTGMSLFMIIFGSQPPHLPRGLSCRAIHHGKTWVAIPGFSLLFGLLHYIHPPNSENLLIVVVLWSLTINLDKKFVSPQRIYPFRLNSTNSYQNLSQINSVKPSTSLSSASGSYQNFQKLALLVFLSKLKLNIAESLVVLWKAKVSVNKGYSFFRTSGTLLSAFSQVLLKVQHISPVLCPGSRVRAAKCIISFLVISRKW